MGRTLNCLPAALSTEKAESWLIKTRCMHAHENFIQPPPLFPPPLLSLSCLTVTQFRLPPQTQCLSVLPSVPPPTYLPLSPLLSWKAGNTPGSWP